MKPIANVCTTIEACLFHPLSKVSPYLQQKLQEKKKKLSSEPQTSGELYG